MRRIAAFTVLALNLCSPALGAETPVAVSPGSADGVAQVELRCPTFSWGQVEGAKSYELVVYRVGDGANSEPVLGETFAGSVSGWTPSLDRCLERGEQYAWSVRAVRGSDASEWSVPSLFQVAPGPSEAEFEELLALVKRYPAQVASGAAGTPPAANRTVPGEVGPEGRTRQAERTSHGPDSGVVISERSIFIGGRPVVLAEGKIVFVSSATYQGNLGRLAGADAKCNGLAEAAGLAGVFKAWLSESSCGPATVDMCRDFTQSDEGYVRIDGQRVADDWADLTDGTIQHPINIDEAGNQVAGGPVWTNTTGLGDPAGGNTGNCVNWITNSSGGTGLVGDSDPFGGVKQGNWTKRANNPLACDAFARIYCFQQ